ncbi:hypothetical protein GALMADRAFT_1082608 [Galerina marginata CBS 339.88]|uniref:F-box domain-containing protein n=1 Tax=Galerina marginata (strain CBS 339.88) TaxID=685588 RepID=A0A067SLE6_GALM3|nr:hypothetical protein GALMADRAFT_1082608 [Galerina marginata CBS 339.88]
MKKSKQNMSSDSTFSGSSLPFQSLQANELRQLYAFGTRPTRKDRIVLLRGNYVAGHISCKIRKEARANNKVQFHALRNVIEFPLELVFEIFVYLHPIDLYNLMRSSKELRSLLLSRESSPIWREVFQQHPSVPPCPSHISFPKWVSILFGPATCDKCGYPEAMMDFVFLDRLCNFCMVKKLFVLFQALHLIDPIWQAYHRLYAHRDSLIVFCKVKGIYEPEFGQLLKTTYRRNAMHYPSARDSSRQMIYSRHEVNEVAEICSAFLSAVERSEPNAQQNYEEYKVQTVNSVRDAMKRAIACNTWAVSICSEINREYDNLVEQWKERLQILGHNPIDLATLNIRTILQHRHIRTFSKTAFKRSLPAIQKMLSYVTSKRLAVERFNRRWKRQREVQDFYRTHRESLEFLSKGYHPPVDHIYRIKEISDWIDSDLGLEFPPDAKEHFQHYIDKYRAYRRSQVSRLMRGEYPSLDFEENPLRLATTVFECPLHKITETEEGQPPTVLVGWYGFDDHFQCIVPENPGFQLEDVDLELSFNYNPAGSKTMKHLLGVVGLDPSTASPERLNSLRVRFLCIFAECREHPRLEKGRPAMTLKECVSHAARNLDHTPEYFQVLSKEATNSAIFHEGFPPEQLRHLFPWHCRHCIFVRSGHRQLAIDHVKEMHSIDYPIEDQDYIFLRWGSCSERKPFRLHLNPPGNYRCNHCHDNRKLRLWTHRQIVSHLRDKHSILQQLVPNTDWVQISLFKEDRLLGLLHPANTNSEGGIEQSVEI